MNMRDVVLTVVILALGLIGTFLVGYAAAHNSAYDRGFDAGFDAGHDYAVRVYITPAE